MLVTLRKCGQDHDKIQGRLVQQRNCENSSRWRCFWLHSTHTTTSNHSCSPQASVSWRGPSGPEPGRLWKKVPPGSIITNCTVPELCSQKPCGDMANPNLLAPIGKPQLTSGTRERLPLDPWPYSLWPAMISVARRWSKKVPGLQIKDFLWVSQSLKRTFFQVK